MGRGGEPKALTAASLLVPVCLSPSCIQPKANPVPQHQCFPVVSVCISHIVASIQFPMKANYNSVYITCLLSALNNEHHRGQKKKKFYTHVYNKQNNICEMLPCLFMPLQWKSDIQTIQWLLSHWQRYCLNSQFGDLIVFRKDYLKDTSSKWKENPRLPV